MDTSFDAVLPNLPSDSVGMPALIKFKEPVEYYSKKTGIFSQE